jgi:hypothetical protein
MKNHLHLLIEVGETPLSRIMQTLLFEYAGYFNRQHGEVGHLFQGRYKAIVCDKDAYLLELVRYIHLNPVRARMVKDPEDYGWTGHLSYLRKGEEGLIDEGFVLGQFSENRSLARRRYRRFVWEGISLGHERKYYHVKDQRYLGEDSFIEQIEAERTKPEDGFYEIPLEAICREVSRDRGIEEDGLYSVRRDRKGAAMRGMVAYVARRVSEYSVKERRLVGERVNIFKGTPLGFTEAPHLYKRNGWYYLLTAEGGTGWGHAVTMARSRTLTGPYALHPDQHILSARHRPDVELQRAGHADLVETPDGETYMVYLCGRPLRNRDLFLSSARVMEPPHKHCIEIQVSNDEVFLKLFSSADDFALLRALS